jgi:hypothetical protein
MPDRYAYAPGTYDREALHANPTGAVPGPLSMENRGYWSDANRRLTFQRSLGGPPFTWPADSPYGALAYGFGAPVPYARALWQAGPFDLRPDLRASASADHTLAYPINRGGAYGAGAAMAVMIQDVSGALASLPLNQQLALEFYALEFGHVQTPELMTPLEIRQNITSHVWAAGSGAALIPFIPPANPIRYWSIAIIADVIPIDNVDPSSIPTTLSIWGTLQ